MEVGKVYIQKGKGPSGVRLQVGPRGGKYYIGNPKTGEPAKEQPKSKEKDKDVKVKSKKRDFLSKKIEIYLEEMFIHKKNSQLQTIFQVYNLEK